MSKKTEYFEIVDGEDRVVGVAPRSRCHGDPTLVHRVAHVLVFNSSDQLLLQKRARTKDVQPGRWDTSVGGHLDPGETYLDAARREMVEELGISGIPLTYLYPSRIRNSFESENVATYLAHFDGEVNFHPEEIEEVRFWDAEEIEAALGTGIFTPNFEEEWGRLREWDRRYPSASEGKIAFCAGDTFADLAEAMDGEEKEGA